MIINIQDDILKIQALGLLDRMLADKTTKKHIMAPTRIIYLIATNYILGFDKELKAETHNFVEADSAEAAKEGNLEELVEKWFGEGN